MSFNVSWKQVPCPVVLSLHCKVQILLSLLKVRIYRRNKSWVALCVYSVILIPT